MKKLTSSFLLLCACFMAAVMLPSCSQELVTPEKVTFENSKINSRTDFSGLENQVKAKIAERDHIDISDVLTCYYDGTTTQGYGLYNYSTNIPSSGVFTVTGIIGDDVEGW